MDKSVVNCWKDRIAVWSMVRTNCDMMCDFIDGLIRRLSGWMVFGGVENFFLSSIVFCVCMYTCNVRVCCNLTW